VETATVTLMLLDVEVTDRDGQPVRGLTLRDFKVRMDGKDWPVESVDDLCPCGASVAQSDSLDSTPTEPGLSADRGRAAPDDVAPATSAEPVPFILYLDFIQLETNGRDSAIRHAKRWIQEVMQPGDRVMIVGHATPVGQRVIAPLTSDRDALLAALDKVSVDREWVDPFPSFLKARVDECIRDLPGCPTNVAEEYHYGRRSLEALRQFLAGLESVPGRKQLILFMQNGTIFPGELYGRPSDDHERRVDDTIAEATMSRVTINAASVGYWVDPLAIRLAEGTGGLYNKLEGVILPMMEQARRRCACVYRLGLQPPAAESRKLHRVAVFARGRRLPDRITQSLPAIDRWLRSARGVLMNPAEADALRIVAGIVPTGADDGWSARVQIGFELGSLTTLPAGGEHQGSWEVGAVLERKGGGSAESWEMLGMSQVRKTSGGASSTWVVHERKFEHLRPGDYRLAAFVRDTTANVFGGAEATIALPRPGRSGLAGPVLMRSNRLQILSTLPLLGEAGKNKTPSREATTVTAPVPSGHSIVSPRDLLEVSTWLCGRKTDTAPAGRLLRFIAAKETPILKFPDEEPEPAGRCSRITDSLELWRPTPGSYTYNVRLLAADGSEIGTATVPIEISGPFTGEAAADSGPKSPSP